jgi:hypothetical protein
MQNSCVQKSKRNRKRSRRRAIFCPVHGTYLDSVSQKYSIYADQPGQLQERGIAPTTARLLMAQQVTVGLTGEWIEAFWCEHCQQQEWYHVKKTGDRAYEIVLAPAELWQQVQGVTHPRGNPSVSEFTLKASQMVGHQGMRQYRFVG